MGHEKTPDHFLGAILGFKKAPNVLVKYKLLGGSAIDAHGFMKYTLETKVFVETSIFSAVRTRLLSDQDFRRLQTFLTFYPDAGHLVPGCKGLRKLRWGHESKGKRSGVRIIYYWAVALDQILLLDLFAKNENANLTQKQYRVLSDYIQREYP